MSILKKFLDGAVTAAYKTGLQIFFKTSKGKDFSKKYGVTFNPSITLSKLPLLTPPKNEFYKLDPSIGVFEIVEIDSKKFTIVIREICTEDEFKMSIDLFYLIFMKIQKPDVDIIIDSIK